MLLEQGHDGLDHPESRKHVVGRENLFDIGDHVVANHPRPPDPEVAAAVTQLATAFRQVLVVGAPQSGASPGVGRHALVAAQQVDALQRRPDPHLLAHEAPGNRVLAPVEDDVAVGVHGCALPGRGHVGPRGKRLQRGLLLCLEQLEWLDVQRAVVALTGDLEGQPVELLLGIDDVRQFRRSGQEEAPLHVLDGRLDLALLLRVPHRRGIDLEVVVPRQLDEAAVQPALVAVDAERGADHRGLEVVGDDDLGHATEPGERLDVQPEPRLRPLVEHDLGEQVAAEAEDADEDPGVTHLLGLRVEQLPDVAEVDVGGVPRSGLDGDGDVVGLHTLGPAPRPPDAFHSGQAPLKALFFEPERVVHGLGERALAGHRLDLRHERLKRRLLLRRRLLG